VNCIGSIGALLLVLERLVVGLTGMND